MIPSGLERLQVGGLLIDLPRDRTLPDLEQVERYLRPFAADSAGRPDITLVHRPRETGVGDPPANGASVTTRRYLGAAPNYVAVESRYDIAEASGGFWVSGPLTSVPDLVGAIHIGLAFALPPRCGLLLHASVAVAHGLAFVFPGPSETGKSTAARGFVGGSVLCDERCLVRRTDEGWIVAAVPMAKDEYAFGRPESVPLGVVAFVVKDAPLALRSLEPVAAVRRLTAGVVHRRYDAEGAERLIGVLPLLASEVPCVELSYKPGEAFAPALLRRVGAAADPGRAFQRGAS